MGICGDGVPTSSPEIIFMNYAMKDWNNMIDEERSQFYQALLELRISEEYNNISCDNERRQIDKALETYRPFFEKANIGVKSSKTHLQVSRVLGRDMGLDCDDEYITNEGYSVDIRLEGIWKDRKNGSKKQLCIEVDGPSHYYGNSRRVTASTLMKHRHLRACGWHVISIPYWEVNTLKTLPKYLDSELSKYKAM